MITDHARFDRLEKIVIELARLQGARIPNLMSDGHRDMLLDQIVDDLRSIRAEREG